MQGSVDVIVPIQSEFEFNITELMDFIRKHDHNILWDKHNEGLKEMFSNYLHNPPSPLKALRKHKSANYYDS